MIQLATGTPKALNIVAQGQQDSRSESSATLGNDRNDMIGRGKRYPLVRHVTEDEIRRGLFRSRQRAVQLERIWLDRRFVRLETQGGAAFAELLPLTLGYGV